MSPGVAQVRADICGDCIDPCFPRPDVSDPCAACPIGRWGQHDCGSAPAPKLGDRLADEIERRVLTPAEAFAPGVVQAVRKCGGCGHTQHRLGTDRAGPDGPII